MTKFPEGGDGLPSASDAAPAPATLEAAQAVEPVVLEGLPSFRAGTQELSIEARGKFTDKDVSGYVPSADSEQLLVRLNQFEGPLDLLLHLLDKHALNIFDIPIKTIVQEYMKVLDQMRDPAPAGDKGDKSGGGDFNLDIAGEFLVMAAQLAHIKSKMLLPKEERAKDDDAGVDPRADLVRQLLEYQRFKAAAIRLDELPHLGRDFFARPDGRVQYDGPVAEVAGDIHAQLNLAEIDPFELIRLFGAMLKKQQKLVVHEVLLERISVGARINEIVDIVGDGRDHSFAELCDRFGARTRKNVIVTFLAVLEMTRLKLTRVVQDDDGTIMIQPVMDNLRADEDALKAALGNVEEFEKPADGAADGAADDDSPQEASA